MILYDYDNIFHERSALIFDFDGTIADTARLHERAFKETLRPLGIEVDYVTIAGLKTADAILKCLRASQYDERRVDLAMLVNQKQARVRELLRSDLTGVPAIEAFIEAARARFRLSLVTSGSKTGIDIALHKLGYLGWFDPIVCAEDVMNAKPSPEGYALALKLMRVDAHEALVFEDSDAGFEAARRAGIDVVDVNNFSWLLAAQSI